ncbi:MAG TPA: LptA/OstA family protein [Acidocella sp.]|uniref:LptA/OstA family protein n=1 Tax=Acidocella sp. TaxID=50710 RepID=UPI002CA4F371|nr:LptA/OstA family protein [Acidocella sp.]HVE20754.1 LptA/OstA family protein [Acidocella sp.]
MKQAAAFFGGLALATLLLRPAQAQTLDLSGSQQSGPPLPIQINASQSIQWNQQAQTVTATGNAKAVRGNVTVTADELIAHYRKKAAPPGAKPVPAPTPSSSTAGGTNNGDPLDQGGNELYELDAVGDVHIYTATDNAWGDHAVYSLDNAVLVLTGQHLKLTTQHDVITAKDALEYYAQKRMAVARGDALIVADTGRSIAADTLIGYLAPPAAANAPRPASRPDQNADPLDQAGQLQKVDAIGHVVVRTTTDTATGDRGVYLPPTGLARLGGDVHVIHGPNQLTGNDALVNMKTGVATLLAAPGGQVAGTIVPNAAPPAPGAATARPSK